MKVSKGEVSWLYLMRLTPYAESTRGFKLDLGYKTGLQVGDLHGARMLYVRLSHDVQGRGYLQSHPGEQQLYSGVTLHWLGVVRACGS